MYGQEYALYDLKTLSQAEVAGIRTASERISQIFHKTAHLLRVVDDETLHTLGFPQSTLPFIRLKMMQAETVISRLDLVETEGTYKVLELNADTPTFIKELFHVNGRVCEEFAVRNPNEGEEEKLAHAVTSVIKEACNGTDNPYVVFTAHQENDEDTYTAKYLQSLAEFPARFVPLSKLRIVASEGLYDEEGRKIEVLYRQTYPIEQLVLDRSEQDERIGEMLLELVEQKQLAIINPPSAFLLQSKAVQAAIWGLHEEGNEFFTELEHTWIEEYFLQTYLECDPFIEQGQPYVKKPAFGREGDTVEVYNPNGDKLFEDENKSYKQYLSVYQRYVDLPKTSFLSEKGMQEGHVMIGSFLLNGAPSAIGLRVGNRITDNLSYYLPVGVE
ncbi:glutathionylspermidine synthase family protein [Bacillus tianshenii]|nr:glutathionylspermidine synthase family protein [Bacillus tianshenii]